MTLPDSQLPNRIRYWRKARDLTQQQLADFIDMRLQTLNRYETGTRVVSLHALKRIAKGLHVEVPDLLPDDLNGMVLSAAEMALVLCYRNASPLGKANLEALAESIDKVSNLD
jgi:transcriptional regulator with XRE-family HTH domain